MPEGINGEARGAIKRRRIRERIAVTVDDPLPSRAESCRETMQRRRVVKSCLPHVPSTLSSPSVRDPRPSFATSSAARTSFYHPMPFFSLRVRRMHFIQFFFLVSDGSGDSGPPVSPPRARKGECILRFHVTRLITLPSIHRWDRLFAKSQRPGFSTYSVCCGNTAEIFSLWFHIFTVASVKPPLFSVYVTTRVEFQYFFLAMLRFPLLPVRHGDDVFVSRSPGN